MVSPQGLGTVQTTLPDLIYCFEARTTSPRVPMQAFTVITWLGSTWKAVQVNEATTYSLQHIGPLKVYFLFIFPYLEARARI